DGAIRIEDKFQNTMAQVEAASSSTASTSFFVADRSNRRYVEGVEYPNDVITSIRQLGNVAATSSVLKGLVAVQSPLRTESGQAYGIVLNDHLSVSDLEDQMLFGSIENFRETPT